jgi:hypothetical protein
MCEHNYPATVRRLAPVAVAFLLGWGAAGGAEPSRSPAVGQLVSPDATLLERGKPGQPWQAVSQKGEIHAGDLLVGLPGAVIESGKGAVHLTLLTDMEKNSPYPIFEAAVILHDSPDVDTDFTLDRGRVDVTNTKEKGSARVRIRFHDQKWEATLQEPGARIALELYGRWPKGVRFNPEPGPKDVPGADLVFLVRKGHVDVNHGACQHAMSAPPGPALLHWSNSGEADQSPQRLEKLPDWTATEEATSERALRIKKVIEEFRQEMAKSSPAAALEAFATSDNPNHRATGVIFMGAIDDLDGLARVLTETKYPDAWDRAVVVLRHWIGRRPGQDQVIYRSLLDKRKMTPAQAATTMQLLHSFGDADLAQPELYKMLVKFLDAERLGVRGLAHWHLVRLVPAGKKIDFNPLDPKEKRDKARDEWKKLVDDMLTKGELPPKESPK